MLNNVPVKVFGFLNFLFVWTITDSSLSFLVSLVRLKNYVWLFWVHGDDWVSDAEQPFRGSDLVHIPSALELSGGWSCLVGCAPLIPSDPCSNCFVSISLFWQCTWLLPALCEIFLCSPKNCHLQHHLGSSSCIMLRRFRMSALHYWHLSTLPSASDFGDSEIHIHWVFLQLTVGRCWPCLVKPTAYANQRYQQ